MLILLVAFSVFQLVLHQPVCADPITLTRPGHIACATEYWLDKNDSMTDQNDMAAVNKLITEGKCMRMRGDIQVFVEEAIGNPIDKVKIRPKGETGSVWTHIKALRLQ